MFLALICHIFARGLHAQLLTLAIARLSCQQCKLIAYVVIAGRCSARGSTWAKMAIFNLYTRKYLTNRKYVYGYTVNHN